MTLEEAIYHTETRKKMVQSTCFSCWSEDAEMGLQALYFMKKMQWIPVSERLPEENEYAGDVWKYYLVQDEYGDIYVAHLSKRGWEPTGALYTLRQEIVAWMPLPEPYKAEREEE